MNMISKIKPRPKANLKAIKEYDHCGEKFRIKKKIAQFDMEGGVTHHIFLSSNKCEGDAFCLMFTQAKNERTATVTKITDAYTLWYYWTEEERQTWILKRDDAKLWKEARKVIDRFQKMKKNNDVLPLISW